MMASIHGGEDVSTVADLFERYATTVSPLKRGTKEEQHRLARLPRQFALFRRSVMQFDAPSIAEWRDDQLARVSALTLNRELNLISAVMQTALLEWRVPGLTHNPVRNLRRPENPRPRKQRVSGAEQAAIVTKLGWDGASEPVSASQWTAFAFTLAIATAMRRGEILSIRWSNIYVQQKYIFLENTKNGNERRVPLSSQALALIALIEPRASHARLVPVNQASLGTLFARARDAAGLRHIRFHDSRREATTTMSTKLSNVLELAAVTGHRSLQVLKGYYEPDPSALADKLG
jgi:integrase